MLPGWCPLCKEWLLMVHNAGWHSQRVSLAKESCSCFDQWLLSNEMHRFWS